MGITEEPVAEFERAMSGAGAPERERGIDATAESPGMPMLLDDAPPRTMRLRDAPPCLLEPCSLSVEPVAEAWP